MYKIKMNDYPFLNTAIMRVLKRRREALKLSKRKLAELAQLERAYIIQLEQGTKRPTLNALYYLCDALQITRQTFIDEIETEIKHLQKEAKANFKN